MELLITHVMHSAEICGAPDVSLSHVCPSFPTSLSGLRGLGCGFDLFRANKNNLISSLFFLSP